MILLALSPLGLFGWAGVVLAALGLSLRLAYQMGHDAGMREARS